MKTKHSFKTRFKNVRVGPGHMEGLEKIIQVPKVGVQFHASSTKSSIWTTDG